MKYLAGYNCYLKKDRLKNSDLLSLQRHKIIQLYNIKKGLETVFIIYYWKTKSP